MKKEEIKYDPIRDSFLKGLTYISENPNNVLKLSIGVLIFLLVLILFNNNSDKKNLTYNKFISITTNKHLDNQTDLSISSFKEALSSYNKSESYNQAYVYMFNYYMEENLLDSIDVMIKNSKFSTHDDNVNASINLMYGDFFLRKNDTEQAISSYRNAIEMFDIYDRQVYAKLKLCMVFIDLSMNEDFNTLYSSINIDDVSDFQTKSLYEQIHMKN